MSDKSSTSKKPPDQEAIDLIRFVSSVPPPLTTALVRLSPYITWLRRAIEITNWKSSWEDSWLLIAAWWALCLLVGIGKQYVFFSGRVLAFLNRASQARHSCARRCSTRLAEVGITPCFTFPSSHRKPHSSHHFGLDEDSRVSTSTSAGHAPTPLRPTARDRGALHPLFDSRFPRPPAGDHSGNRDYYSDVEGPVGDNRSGRFVE